MAKGNFIEYVISDVSNKYPNNGEQDGYYYKRVITETEEKTVTAGTSPIEVIPSEGKSISKVTVNPTPTEEKTIIPTTEDLIVTPVEGKLLSQVTVQGDANFLEENIAEGITIWGKTGTHQGGNSSGQYAWKKTEKTTTGLAGNVNFTTTDKDPLNNYQYHKCTGTSSVSGLISQFIEDDCIGLELNCNFSSQDGYSWTDTGRLVLGSGGSTTYYSYDSRFDTEEHVNTNRNVTWSYSSGVITLNFQGWGGGNYIWEGSKYINKQTIVTNFINFVVSNNSSEYPTNGQHTDGYYYSSISQ